MRRNKNLADIASVSVMFVAKGDSRCIIKHNDHGATHVAINLVDHFSPAVNGTNSVAITKLLNPEIP